MAPSKVSQIAKQYQIWGFPAFENYDQGLVAQAAMMEVIRGLRVKGQRVTALQWISPYQRQES